ncbi:MAG: nucleotidyltransferase domain-containing protein [Candidatus Atribacteria bacterium]|nr:nucleotidyltransferase domain-containing protein [Candidatus Atribacteria bacterium]
MKVILFGSVAEDRATPMSDVDIVLIVNHTDRRFLERPREYTSFFDGCEIPVDLLIYTRNEMEENPPTLLSHALQSGIVLYEAGSEPRQG